MSDLLVRVNPLEHYKSNVGPIEKEYLPECEVEIENIGWTLGNECPYRCKHCYSMSARRKGRDLTTEIIDRVVEQVSSLRVRTINLGGNEPLFTNGPDPRKTLLPYIIRKLVESGIDVGLTTSGITAMYLAKHHKEEFLLLNDVDISIDSPYPEEHNQNRGTDIFRDVLEALQLCRDHHKEFTLVMCAMNWNFTEDRIRALVELCTIYGCNVRINPIKPVETRHMKTALTAEQYYTGFSLLMELCESLDLTEPTLAAASNYTSSKRCPCGRKSFRIHSITPDGKIPISPCVYLHDFKVGNLLEDDLSELILSPQFQSFRRRNRNPEAIEGCSDCEINKICGGGCASRSYLYHLHTTGERSLFVKDPFCPKEQAKDHQFPQNPVIHPLNLVHRDYLCTWIGKPKALLPS
ncbi:radical SAM protein [Paenibacillus oralis]|uniref:Radical SAM protein n=1 Tax=Paenibacillus oralis TaxID=2490856 RepID=A0A3P3TZ53_9BACL|nr:radical SAM protein [Paenibacillus oralis]RRJ63385.1 radical SAM protein [Paenibacillus oralis]